MSDEPTYTKPYRTYTALASKVLVVAVPGSVGDWAAYCDAVPGMRHRDETEEVARHGDKISKELAVVMFPQFDPAMFRRD